MVDSRFLNAFNSDFCEYLECYLTRALSTLADNPYERYWCDGILVPEMSDQMLDTEDSIITWAWIGLDGQTRYRMIIKLGECALSSIANDINLKDCLPSAEYADWIQLDTEKHIVELRMI